MIQTMLVAVDGSDQSIEAAKMAGELAGKCGSRLVVMHVLLHRDLANLHRMAEVEHMAKPPEYQLGMTSEITQDVASTMRELEQNATPYDVLNKLGQSILRTAEQAARDAGAGSVDLTVKDGDPVEEILQTAKTENADLIVLGTRGIGPIQSMIMGSVSNKVCQAAPCSCLMVK